MELQASDFPFDLLEGMGESGKELALIIPSQEGDFAPDAAELHNNGLVLTKNGQTLLVAAEIPTDLLRILSTQDELTIAEMDSDDGISRSHTIPLDAAA